MTQTTYRGVVRGGTILLDGNTRLPDGTEVVVTPATIPPEACGSAAALLAALKTAPPVPSEWVDELEELIEQGRRPPSHPDPFADEPGTAGRP